MLSFKGELGIVDVTALWKLDAADWQEELGVGEAIHLVEENVSGDRGSHEGLEVLGVQKGHDGVVMGFEGFHDNQTVTVAVDDSHDTCVETSSKKSSLVDVSMWEVGDHRSLTDEICVVEHFLVGIVPDSD